MWIKNRYRGLITTHNSTTGLQNSMYCNISIVIKEFIELLLQCFFTIPYYYFCCFHYFFLMFDIQSTSLCRPQPAPIAINKMICHTISDHVPAVTWSTLTPSIVTSAVKNIQTQNATYVIGASTHWCNHSQSVNFLNLLIGFQYILNSLRSNPVRHRNPHSPFHQVFSRRPWCPRVGRFWLVY